MNNSNIKKVKEGYNMSVKILRFSNLYAKTIISLLICALFLAYYSVDFTIDAYKRSTENSSSVSRDNDAKTGNSTNKLKFAGNKLTDSEQEEILSDNVIADNHYASFEKKWMLFYLYVFSILILSIFTFYIKGWFIKVTHSRFQFHQVHFIQLKDGKKSALSFR